MLSQQPLVTVVTPVLNGARFIEETIESVLQQDYPNLEYIVMDGGSTDETLAILGRYHSRLQFFSQPDGGVAEAINRGFSRSRGSLVGWLSADDTYLPNAIACAVKHFQSAPDAAVVYGEGVWTDQDGSLIGPYPTVMPFDPAMLERECPLCQPASFIRRDALAAVGMLDASLCSAFDYDLWIRLSRKYSFLAVPDRLATSRMHRANKTLAGRKLMFTETMELLRRHFKYVPVNWVYGYLTFLRDGRDQFFEPLRHSPWTYLMSLPVGSYYNSRKLFRYWREWASLLLRRKRRGLLSPPDQQPEYPSSQQDKY
jgi:glycosyltransferase involved in cell wall biosynthesis